MAEKKAPKKKTPTKASRSTAPRKKTASPKAKPADRYYVGFTDMSVSISISEPNGLKEICQCDGFDAARAAAIDVLVEAIEQAEEELIRLKRARSYEDLRD